MSKQTPSIRRSIIKELSLDPSTIAHTYLGIARKGTMIEHIYVIARDNTEALDLLMQEMKANGRVGYSLTAYAQN